jgi:hypothetical protein
MAEVSAIQPAIAAGLYRNTGTYGTPTWAEITFVRDVNPSMKWNYGDASTRDTKAVLQGKTQMAISGTIVVRADPADAGYQALFTASVTVSASAPDLMILDGDIATEGVKGVRLHANLDFEQNQEIGSIIYTTFAYNPAWHTDGKPSFVEMGAASVPTFTAF